MSPSAKRKGGMPRHELVARMPRFIRFVNHVHKDFRMKSCKLFLAAVGATMLLGSLVSSASARNFSTDNQSFRAAFSAVEFHLPETTVRCHVTLEGSMHRRTVTKVIGSLIGYITRAILGPCQTGRATILRETLPWHVRYSGFQGTLPNITSVITHVIGVSWRFAGSEGFPNCLARSIATEPVVGRYHRDASNHLTAGIEGTIRTGAECLGIAGSFRSDSPRVVLLGTSVPISLMLI
jgi:hypothetical protein